MEFKYFCFCNTPERLTAPSFEQISGCKLCCGKENLCLNGQCFSQVWSQAKSLYYKNDPKKEKKRKRIWFSVAKGTLAVVS